MIDAVIFDLDNTIYNYDYAHEIAFDALAGYAEKNFGVPKDAFRVLHRKAMEEQLSRTEYECAAIHSRLIRYQIILENLKQPFYLAPEMSAAYWHTFLSNLKPEPGIRECLSALKQENYILGIGTNMTAEYQYEKLARLSLLDFFDFIVSSEEVNSEKPDRKIFDWCAKKAGCPVSECVFIGDSFTHDIKGAENAGMIPIWYHPGPDPDHKAADSASGPNAGVKAGLNPENASWADTGGPDRNAPDHIKILRNFMDLPAFLRTL